MMVGLICPRRANVDEHLDHVFKWCPYAKMMWFRSPLGVRFEDLSLPFISWLEHVISHSSLDVISLILSLCYSIWVSRNNFVFMGNNFLGRILFVRLRF